MDSLLGIIASTPLAGIGASRAVNPRTGALTSKLSPLTASLFGGASTLVELSGLGQMLAAAAAFQDQFGALQPGSANSGGGQGFGSNLPSLAAEAQSFVDAFNGLQNNIASIGLTNALLGSSVPGGAALAQTLDSQAQADFANGSSALTTLSQIGIVFQPGAVFGAGTLSINLGTLESAFTADAAGAFSLLSQAARAFGDVAGKFVDQATIRFSTLDALAQTSTSDQLIAGSLLSLAPNGGFNLAAALALGPLTQSGFGSPSTLQAILAANQFELVSALLA